MLNDKKAVVWNAIENGMTFDQLCYKLKARRNPDGSVSVEDFEKSAQRGTVRRWINHFRAKSMIKIVKGRLYKVR